jgi:adenylate cyclase
MELDEAFITRASEGPGVRFDIALGDLCGIGRSDHNRIQLVDPLISREHAIIRRDTKGLCYLTDAGSSNGTSLNGLPVNAPTLLKHGDLIEIGSQQLTFHQPTGAIDSVEQAPGTQIAISLRLVTVLVVDVRGYTVLARELGEAKVSNLMADIFRTAGNLLNAKRSWSQKYIGDAIMGVWLEDQPMVEAEKLAGILEIVLELRALFAQLEKEYELERPLGFGAAVNTGSASIGNMGSAGLKDFTALGDAVNKAFRLESATRQLDCDLILGRSVLDLLVPRPPAERRPELLCTQLKGYDSPEELATFKFNQIAAFRDMILARESADVQTTRALT